MLTGSLMNGTIVVPAAAPVSTTSMIPSWFTSADLPGTRLRDRR